MTGEERSKAWAVWIECDVGQMCLNVESLKAPKESKDFLKNRLWHAFAAGAQAVHQKHPELKT